MSNADMSVKDHTWNESVIQPVNQSNRSHDDGDRDHQHHHRDHDHHRHPHDPHHLHHPADTLSNRVCADMTQLKLDAFFAYTNGPPIVAIIRHLPVKTRFRMMAVSKSFRSAIRQPLVWKDVVDLGKYFRRPSHVPPWLRPMVTHWNLTIDSDYWYYNEEDRVAFAETKNIQRIICRLDGKYRPHLPLTRIRDCLKQLTITNLQVLAMDDYDMVILKALFKLEPDSTIMSVWSQTIRQLSIWASYDYKPSKSSPRLFERLAELYFPVLESASFRNYLVGDSAIISIAKFIHPTCTPTLADLQMNWIKIFPDSSQQSHEIGSLLIDRMNESFRSRTNHFESLDLYFAIDRSAVSSLDQVEAAQSCWTRWLTLNLDSIHPPSSLVKLTLERVGVRGIRELSHLSLLKSLTINIDPQTDSNEIMMIISKRFNCLESFAIEVRLAKSNLTSQTNEIELADQMKNITTIRELSISFRIFTIVRGVLPCWMLHLNRLVNLQKLTVILGDAPNSRPWYSPFFSSIRQLLSSQLTHLTLLYFTPQELNELFGLIATAETSGLSSSGSSSPPTPAVDPIFPLLTDLTILVELTGSSNWADVTKCLIPLSRLSALTQFTLYQPDGSPFPVDEFVSQYFSGFTEQSRRSTCLVLKREEKEDK